MDRNIGRFRDISGSCALRTPPGRCTTSEDLLPTSSKYSMSKFFRCLNKCRKNNFITSRAAVFSLLWNFLVSVIFNYLLGLVPSFKTNSYIQRWPLATNIMVTLVYCCYPLAGCVADIKVGRYRTINWSLHILAVMLVVILILSLPWFYFSHYSYSRTVTLSVIYSLAVMSLLLMFVVSVFNVNIIQFGIDQLHDSPVDHQSQFIHWYFWTLKAGLLISQVSMHIFFCIPVIVEFSVFLIILFLLILLLIISLWMAHCQKKWFLIDQATANPYKQVYAISKFAYKNKIPVRRSAFTYCEDAVPSGLNLGKHKYGGPYTTEEVEDVKAFYGILKVLFALGPLFFIGVAAENIYEKYYWQTHDNDYCFTENLLLSSGLISSIFTVAFIPFYMYLVRPFFLFLLPKMLKRIGIGWLLTILCLISLIVMDTMTYVQGNTICLFQFPYIGNNSIGHGTSSQNGYLLLIPWLFSSIYNMLVYIALYEFICSQSPRSMKGLLIGLSFAIKGVFELFGYVIEILFSHFTKLQSAIPGCGMIYFLFNMCIGILTLPIFVYVARKYQRRLRDEPCLVRRYVEEYYSKIPDERLSNYSD